MTLEKSAIQISSEYAYRENARRHDSPQRVKVLSASRANHWKVEFLEGDDEGIQQQVKSANLLWPWKENKACLREEQQHDALLRSVDESWPGSADPVVLAVTEVLDNSGENVWVHKGEMEVDPEVLERLSRRANMEMPDVTYPAFKDRRGRFHFPWTEAVELAKNLCAAEPTAVLLTLEQQEREWEFEARQPGNAHMVKVINEYRPSNALIRQWATYDNAIADKDVEIKRLRDVIERTVWDLRRDGNDQLAARLDRALRGK